MHVIAVIIGVVWAGFWIYWLAAAVGAKPGRTRWGRFAVIRVALVLLAVLLIKTRTIKHQRLTSDPRLEGIGLALFLAGLAFAVWARLYIGQNWGMPMTEKASPELVATGPYRKVRHPIYSGIILATVGTAVAVGWYWLIATVLLGAFFVFSAFMEERYLAGVFPDTYPGYKRSTKMLIPFVL